MAAAQADSLRVDTVTLRDGILICRCRTRSLALLRTERGRSAALTQERVDLYGQVGYPRAQQGEEQERLSSSKLRKMKHRSTWPRPSNRSV